MASSHFRAHCASASPSVLVHGEQADPFSVTAANWGTAGAPNERLPRSTRTSRSLSLLFAGPCTSPQIEFPAELRRATRVHRARWRTTQPEVIASSSTSPRTPSSPRPSTSTSARPPRPRHGLTYDIPMSIQYTSNSTSRPDNPGGDCPCRPAQPGSAQLHLDDVPPRRRRGQNNVTITLSNTGTGDSSNLALSVSAPSASRSSTRSPRPVARLRAANVSGTVEFFVPVLP